LQFADIAKPEFMEFMSAENQRAMPCYNLWACLGSYRTAKAGPTELRSRRNSQEF